MSQYKAPRAILNHPGVMTCDYGPATGVEDYRHDVWLKPGWHFAAGRNAGGRGGHYNSAARFLSDKPTAAPGARELEESKS